MLRRGGVDERTPPAATTADPALERPVGDAITYGDPETPVRVSIDE